MLYYGEERIGVFDKTLIQSALARPQYTKTPIFFVKLQLFCSDLSKTILGTAEINAQKQP
jgi:hypothetical protein